VLVKFNYKKRGAELDLKVIINFVYGSQLLEGLICETKHIVLLIKLPKQNSRCISRLVWYDLFVVPGFEVITSGDVCSLMERCTPVDKCLEIVHI
jgi:hypothetical protein